MFLFRIHLVDSIKSIEALLINGVTSKEEMRMSLLRLTFEYCYIAQACIWLQFVRFQQIQQK